MAYNYILIAINYYTRWIKVETFHNCIAPVVTEFLKENIVTRFGMPFFLVCDYGAYFALIFLTQWSLENQVIVNFSSKYYP